MRTQSSLFISTLDEGVWEEEEEELVLLEGLFGQSFF